MKNTNPLPASIAILVLVVVGVEVLGLDLSPSPASLVLRLQHAQRERLAQLMYDKIWCAHMHHACPTEANTVPMCHTPSADCAMCTSPKWNRARLGMMHSKVCGSCKSICTAERYIASTFWRSAVSACDIYLDMSDAGLLFALSQLLPVWLLPAPW